LALALAFAQSLHNPWPRLSAVQMLYAFPHCVHVRMSKISFDQKYDMVLISFADKAG